MSISVHEFVVNALKDMNFETDGVSESTPLGEDGIELESLSIAELVMQVEEHFGIKYSDEDVEAMQAMTFGDFVERTDRHVEQFAGSRSE